MNIIDFSTEKLTAFIKEVCLEYSELLFFTNKCIHEIRELETVKIILNERYKRFHKLSSLLENELNDIKKGNSKSNYLEGSSGIFNFDDKDNRQYSLNIELNRLKETVEVEYYYYNIGL